MIDTQAYEEAVYQYKLDTITLTMLRKEMMENPGRDSRKQFEAGLAELKKSHRDMLRLETKLTFDALVLAHERLGLAPPRADEE